MWKLRLLCLVGAVSLLSYAAYIIPQLPANPPIPKAFRQIIRLNRPNPLGDQLLYCEWCSPSDSAEQLRIHAFQDRFVGVTTHYLYKNMEEVARGDPLRKVEVIEMAPTPKKTPHVPSL